MENLVTTICKGNKLYKGMVNPLNAALRGAAMAGAISLGTGFKELGVARFSCHTSYHWNSS